MYRAVKLDIVNQISSAFVLHRQFLFKQGSGSSALLSGAGQGYPLTSGTVYSPPPRPLPRSSVTRPLFTFNKPHRCCNWKCTALSASLLTLTLALLLTYVIGELHGTIDTSVFSSLASGVGETIQRFLKWVRRTCQNIGWFIQEEINKTTRNTPVF